jgi:tRNA(Arg) A34 adenosine deaminase TadA
MRKQGISLGSTPWLPAWLVTSGELDGVYAGNDARIALVIDLARRNVEHSTGGPFGAAVFDEDGRVVAAGVNRVEPLQVSLAHAEILALVGAQRRLGRARLNGDGRRYTLANSAQPCCQCFGAIVWAGVDELLIAARKEDVESLAGFDEGPLPGYWVGELGRRDIHVERDLRREDARAVLAAYASRGGARY